MAYEFSLGSFFIGLLILAIGVVFMLWHRVIADNLGSGASSYDRFKFWALMICILGVIVSVNLHWFMLGNLFLMIFPKIS